MMQHFIRRSCWGHVGSHIENSLNGAARIAGADGGGTLGRKWTGDQRVGVLAACLEALGLRFLGPQAALKSTCALFKMLPFGLIDDTKESKQIIYGLAAMEIWLQLAQKLNFSIDSAVVELLKTLN